MIKILPAQSIREWDKFTISNEPVSSINLMERACQAFTRIFVDRYPPGNKVAIVCGTGNNGGDGLGIARLLHQQQYRVKVFIIQGDGAPSEDFLANQRRLPSAINFSEINKQSAPIDLSDRDVVVDAIFGSGLSRPLEGIYLNVVRQVNNARAPKVAVDVPSGLMMDQPTIGDAIQAEFTITFQAPKLAFMFPSSAKFIGDWVAVDIGLHEGYLKEAGTRNFYITLNDIRAKIAPRKKFAHKGDFGRALLVAGGFGKIGASVLAAKAALRSGAGLLTVHVPQCGYNILQTSVPEAMVSADDDEFYISIAPHPNSYTAIGIGPGIGTNAETLIAFRKILAANKPMVIDADGLNMLASHQELMHVIPAGSILTPHPKEFQRMVGECKDDFHRLELQRKLAHDTRAVVVLKGANTSIVTPAGDCFFNSTGNPGMAKGGSGDVLTGVLTALLAQGYSAEDAATVGVYIHGLAGDIACREKGEISMVATDIISALPQAFLSLSEGAS